MVMWPLRHLGKKRLKTSAIYFMSNALVNGRFPRQDLMAGPLICVHQLYIQLKYFFIFYLNGKIQ